MNTCSSATAHVWHHLFLDQLLLAKAFATKRRKQGVNTAGTPDASASAKLVSHLAEVLLQSAVLVGQA